MKSIAILCFVLLGLAFGQEESCGIIKCSESSQCEGGATCVVGNGNFSYCPMTSSEFLQLKNCSYSQIKAVFNSQMDALIEMALENRGLGAFLQKDLGKRMLSTLLPYSKSLVEDLDIKGILENSAQLRGKVNTLLADYLKDTSMGFKGFLRLVMAAIVDDVDFKLRLLKIIEKNTKMVAETAQSLAESMADKDAYDDLVETLNISDQLKNILKEPEIYDKINTKVQTALKYYTDSNFKQRVIDMVKSMSTNDLSMVFSNMPDMSALVQKYLSGMVNDNLLKAMNVGNAKDVLTQFLKGKGEDVRMAVQGWISGGKLPFSLSDNAMFQAVLNAITDNKGLIEKVVKGVTENRALTEKAVEWMRQNGRELFEKLFNYRDEIKDMLKDRFGNINDVHEYVQQKGSEMVGNLKGFINDNSELIKAAMEASAKAKIDLVKRILVLLLKNKDALNFLDGIVTRYPDQVYRVVEMVLEQMDKVNLGGSVNLQGNANMGAIVRLILADRPATLDILRRVTSDPRLGLQVTRILSGGSVNTNTLMNLLMPSLMKMNSDTRNKIIKLLLANRLQKPVLPPPKSVFTTKKPLFKMG